MLLRRSVVQIIGANGDGMPVADYEYKFIKLHKSMNEDTNISTPQQRLF